MCKARRPDGWPMIGLQHRHFVPSDGRSRGEQLLWRPQAVYAINIYLGRKQNDEVALAWAAQFCEDGAVLDRNFSLLGTGNNSGEVSTDGMVVLVGRPAATSGTAS